MIEVTITISEDEAASLLDDAFTIISGGYLGDPQKEIWDDIKYHFLNAAKLGIENKVSYIAYTPIKVNKCSICEKRFVGTKYNDSMHSDMCFACSGNEWEWFPMEHKYTCCLCDKGWDDPAFFVSYHGPNLICLPCWMNGKRPEVPFKERT